MKKKYNFLIWFLIINSISFESSAKNFNFLNKNFKDSNEGSFEKDINNSENFENKINNFFKLIVENIQEYNEELDQFSNLEIISDKQSSTGEEFIAQGNVLVRNNKIILKADKLVFNDNEEELFIEGNIIVQSKGQFLKSTEIAYNIKKKEGYILNAYGTVNFKQLGWFKSNQKFNNNFDENYKIKNVIFNSSTSLSIDNYNLKEDEDATFLKRFVDQDIKLDINKMQKWRYKAKKIKIVDNVWSSEILFLTNDPFNNPQLVIHNNNFKTKDENESILITSKWSTLILDDLIKVPLGPRRIKVGDENNFRWGIGYDKNRKDGLFITRSFDPFYFSSDNTQLNIKKEFFIQRALEGKTKSYSAKNKSVLSEKAEQDITPYDLFGLELDFLTEIYGFDFFSNITLSSLDFEKFKKAITLKSELSKKIYKEKKSTSDKEMTFSIFNNYRNKVWNGSLGESEILSAYGTKLEKKNSWINKKIDKSSTISFTLGEYQSGARHDETKLISRKRVNILLESNHRYPIWRPKIQNKLINEDLIYNPSIINYGMDVNAQGKLDLIRYDDKNYQNVFTLKVGPELTLGNFRKKFLDYTKFSIYPKVKISNGQSPFGFDQSVDNAGIEINAKQQLIGALALELTTEYNLDVNSPKYKEFFNTKYQVSWNRRAYNFGIYYNSESETGGINFKIHSFNFDGLGERF